MKLHKGGSEMNERLLDYIKELEIRLMDLGVQLPSMREDIGHLLVFEKNPLLQIELEDIDSVPIVFYKGEALDKKIRVSFDYGTDDDERLCPTYIHIEHFDSNSNSKPNTKIIQHNHPIKE